MSSKQRLGLVALAVAAAAVAFVVARPAGDEAEPARGGLPDAQPAATATTERPPQAEPAPEVERIRIRGGEPVGGVREIGVRRGDTVRITVTSDAPQHVHLHGYDVVRDAAPGAPARFSFEADLEGIFEIELEGPGVQIAELRVEP